MWKATAEIKQRWTYYMQTPRMHIAPSPAGSFWPQPGSSAPCIHTNGGLTTTHQEVWTTLLQGLLQHNGLRSAGRISHWQSDICITDNINFCVENTVPTRKFQCLPKNKPWMTPERKDLINQKRKVFNPLGAGVFPRKSTILRSRFQKAVTWK